MTRCCFPILESWNVSTNLSKTPNIKFHKNVFSDLRAFLRAGEQTGGQTGMAKLIEAFLQLFVLKVLEKC